MTEKNSLPVFISLDEAAKMKEGTRITFIPGLQAIYAEALKNICFGVGVKGCEGVLYIPFPLK